MVQSDALEIFDGLPFESEEHKTGIDLVLAKLEALSLWFPSLAHNENCASVTTTKWLEQARSSDDQCSNDAEFGDIDATVTSYLSKPKADPYCTRVVLFDEGIL